MVTSDLCVPFYFLSRFQILAVLLFVLLTSNFIVVYEMH